MENRCSHLHQIENDQPNKPDGCEECLKIGYNCVYLRLCEICGQVGCCNQSKHKPATEHFRHTKHSIIKSFQPGKDRGWCYIDELFFEPLPAV